MPALPPALDTPQHHALLWQRHPARQEAARAPFRRPEGRRRGCDRSRCSAADGKICAPCMIRGVRAAKRVPSWQDLRAVYPPTAVCGAFRIHGAHILPKSARFRMHGAQILPGSPPFLVRGPFWDTWSEKIATDCRPGTHQGAILPSSGARERISRAFCHRRAAATPQRHVPQHLASRPHRCSRRTPRPCPTCPSLMPPRRPPQRRDAMRRTRRFCRR